MEWEEIKKLSPEERLKKLKELQEKSKKEIEEAQQLMTESQRELEIKEEHERDMPIPQLTSIDIDSLFGQEEKELFRAKRFVETRPAGEGKKDERAGARSREEITGVKDERLEEVIGREKPKHAESAEFQQAMVQYGQRMEEIKGRVYELQTMTKEDPERFHKYESVYKEELEHMKKEFEGMARKYAASSEISEAGAVSSQIDKLISWYKR